MDILSFKKYDRPVPRYTSYPTIPFWKEGLDVTAWKNNVGERSAAGNEAGGISLYIHLPFCEHLCFYCGCNKRITTNHDVEEPYIQAVLQEWTLYRALLPARPVIRELHLGGGTPTFFSPDNLRRLISGILDGARVHPDHGFSVEGHPDNTTREHLEVLYELGFRRVSYGVQDLNQEVQRAIGRKQSFESLRKATEAARAIGFTSVNFDLIYGLPKQTWERLQYTILVSAGLRPDRLAFYSYAHTPWMNCSQRLIDSADLPNAEEKLRLYEQGKSWLLEQGYQHVGMDHFALPSDELFQAAQAGVLHRNFMGYTTQHSDLLLGLGVSAISDTGTAFAQNEKTIGGYYQAIRGGQLAVGKGYFLTEEDRVFRRHILDIACQGSTDLDMTWQGTLEEYTLPALRDMESDGLLILDGHTVRLTEKGRPLLRHVCKAFDLHLLRNERASVEAVQCGNSSIAAPPRFSSAI